MSGRQIVLAEYFTMPNSVLLFIVRLDLEEPVVKEIALDLNELRIFVATNFGAHNQVLAMEKRLWHRYDRVIAPLEDHTQPGDLIYLVPHGLLHYLPLHGLHLGGYYLIERNPVVYCPSASTLKYCQAKRKSTRKTALVLGDSLGNLLGARIEAQVVASLFSAEPCLGQKASKEVIIRQGPNVDILHLACHGEYNRFQALESGILLANGERLTAREIFAWEGVHTYLVTLSACESGVSETRPGDELIGLTRAFLYSVTPSVLVSLWRVDDEAASFLMGQFYTHLLSDQDISKADALQRAQLETMQANNGAWDHLFYWAPFILVGDWQ